MRHHPAPVFFNTPNGNIETLVEEPAGGHEPEGIALVCHPHPLFGGDNEHKVVSTLARTLRQIHYVTLRPNFRGVGRSEGEHDHGAGETEDMLAILDGARQIYGELPVVLAGFSFGAYVQTRVATKLAEGGQAARRLILVGTAVGRVEKIGHFDTRGVPPDTILIHGEHDEIVPLQNVLDWAAARSLHVDVVPAAGHFFHGKQKAIHDIIMRRWQAAAP